MAACMQGHKDVVDKLLEFKHNPNTKDNKGKSSLFYALDSLADNVDVLESLKQAGANINPTLHGKLSPIQYLIH